MRKNRRLVFEIVRDNGPIGRKDKKVKNAGIPLTTFHDTAEEFVRLGVFVKSPGVSGVRGRPETLYEVIDGAENVNPEQV